MIGIGVFDCLSKDITDPDTGEIYPAISCCNNVDMAMRCTSPSADKVIWSIKASAQFNSDCAFLLREGFRSGRIRLLEDEFNAKINLDEIKGFSSMDDRDKIKFQLPYIHTTLLVDELINLQHEESGGKIKIYERSGARKDRYSSLSYNYYVATQLESKLGKRYSVESQVSDMFVIKPPSYKGRAVNSISGNNNQSKW